VETLLLALFTVFWLLQTQEFWTDAKPPEALGDGPSRV